MKKQLIILSSALASGLIGAGLIEAGQWVPAAVCLGWDVLLLWANTKRKPRRAGRGRENESSIKNPTCDDTTVTIGMQSRVWTPAGKALTSIYFEE